MRTSRSWPEGSTLIADLLNGAIPMTDLGERIMKKIYYAHCQANYGTPQEQRDLFTLRALGFEVLNPNSPEVQVLLKDAPKDNKMPVFQPLVESCDWLAFRALPDGSIPAGVAKEIAWAQAGGKCIIELPSAMARRTITVDATREYLRDVGQR
jgi:hypothetical protein